MASHLSLKISVVDNNVVKTMQFDPTLQVYDVCRLIREKLSETHVAAQGKDYGLFLTDEDPKKGVWLEPGRTLEYYMLRNGDLLEYKAKMRTLKVRMLDGSVKTVLVDDSQPIANLMVVICTKIGITNHDEYSLVRELGEEGKDGHGGYSTLTLGRRGKREGDKTIDAKMEQLKKKLKTDDDLNWVDHSKTLREQGIDEDETLLLRRKFFFSDQNIDSRDPIQLNLLYVQARDAIIAGTHPVVVDQACQFGGLQCQIQFGDHVETKHKSGFADLKEFLPKDFVRNKGIEKKLFMEHKRHSGISELDAKVKYVQLARSLKTYGVTFFLVKEKMKGKNKLAPRLLGVTKESVLRLDEKTKEILKTWPLTTVKRWAASPNSFTLDFGDYSDSYYSVQTSEGEQIAQLIAGYIDIILRRKKAKDHFGIEGDEGSTMVEDSVSPYKATILQHQTAPKAQLPDVNNIALPAVLRVPEVEREFERGHMPASQATTQVKGHAHIGHVGGSPAYMPRLHTPDLSPPQRALLSTIEETKEVIKREEEELLEELPEPPRKSLYDVKKIQTAKQISEVSAATAQVINLTRDDDVDSRAVDAAVSTISSNLPEITRGVKIIAALMEDDDKRDRLLDATKRLCSALSDLLKGAEPETKVPRQSLLNAASRVGEATTNLLYTINEESENEREVEFDKETSDILLSIAKGVANAAAELVLKAKDVASKCEDPVVRNRVINSASQCALATSELVATAKVVAPTIEHAECQRQLTDASNKVAYSVELIVSVCHDAVKDEKLTGDLKTAAAAVTRALNELLNEVRDGSVRQTRTQTQTQTQTSSSEEVIEYKRAYSREITSPIHEEVAPVDTIMSATDRLTKSEEDSGEMVRHAKVLAKATAQLISDIKGQAEEQSNSSMQQRLLGAARTLADATARLVEAAKGCASAPNDSKHRIALKEAAEDLRCVTIKQYLVNVSPSPQPPPTTPTPRETPAAIKECDSAIRNIQSMRTMLDNTSESVNNATYFECLESVVSRSRKLGDAMNRMSNSASSSQQTEFAESVREASKSVCGLIEYAAQASYLIESSDASSVAGRPGLVDISAFNAANEAIQGACDQLLSRNSNQKQILESATIIAKHTSSLCNACRSASSRTNNTVAKRHFVQSAKDVANATATLVKEIKALDQEPTSERNRQRCSVATKPLIDAVENLTAFASSPEFSAVPTKMTQRTRAVQEQVTSAGKQLIDYSCGMLLAAKTLAVNQRDPAGFQMLANHSKNVSDSIKKLGLAIRDASPGQRECEKASDTLSHSIRELDQASLNVISQNLFPKKGRSLREIRELLVQTITEVSERVGPVRRAAKGESGDLSQTVTALSASFAPLTDNAINYTAHMVNSKQQMNLLDQTKTVCECMLQLLNVARESAGNPKATSQHAEIDDCADSMKDSLLDLCKTLKSSAGDVTDVTTIVESINKSISKITEFSHSSTTTSSASSQVDYQNRMISSAKEIAKTAQEMVTRSTSAPEKLGGLANTLSQQYANLVVDTAGVVSVTNSLEVTNRLKSSVQGLGSASIRLSRAAATCQDDPRDSSNLRHLAEQAKSVSENVAYVLSALQASSRGTQACINAASTVSGIIGDLDTTIMFATAGTLNAENEREVFSDHRESILKTAKALVEDTKVLVTGAGSTQEQLAVAAQNSVTTIVQLSEVVKAGAASLGSGNSEAQVLLLNAVKDVTASLGDLIHATKNASGKNINDPAMMTLKDSAKVMVTNVTSLLKTVKAVEDEHQRGTRALEQTIDAIAQELRAFDSPNAPGKTSSAEDLVRVTKPVTLATAKAVAAGTSCKQDDVIVAANMGRKAIFDLLVTCKQSAFAAESRDLKMKVLDAARHCALNYQKLLKMVKQAVSKDASGMSSKQMLVDMSRTIAASVTDLVTLTESLKGSDWVDPDDPTVIAETELLGAASSIEAAARKLESLQPRRSSIKLPHEDMNFDEMILDAARSITTATAALVRAASAAQRELVATGRVDSQPASLSDDGQWSEGLISAARHVAAATHSLVEAANALVQGQACEEKLISAAKQVASSTACLLVACKVKADPDSSTMRRLQVAGNAVKSATDNLVRAAQQAIEHEEEQSLVISKRRVSGIAQEILAREAILKKERELGDAREKLSAIRRAKYTHKKIEEVRSYQSEYTTNGNGASK